MAEDPIISAERIAPGLIGSVGALLWIKGSWPRKIAMVGLGLAASYYVAPYITLRFGMEERLAGFLVGLFGMAIVDWMFTNWDGLGLTEILREFLRARLGLPPKDKG